MLERIDEIVYNGSMHKHLRTAMAYAESNTYDDPLDYHLCALIVRGGAVISVGYNKTNTNAFVEHYTDIAKGHRDWCMNTHAEMDAVLKVRGKIDLRGCKIFVARRRKLDGQAANARPCEICQHVLFNYGIKRAYYTISDDDFGQMKIINPANIYDKMVTSEK